MIAIYSRNHGCIYLPGFITGLMFYSCVIEVRRPWVFILVTNKCISLGISISLGYSKANVKMTGLD